MTSVEAEAFLCLLRRERALIYPSEQLFEIMAEERGSKNIHQSEPDGLFFPLEC